MSTDELCPCGSGNLYSRCCEPLHLGHRKAATAEALMRSRYTAFVKKLTDYLISTRHPDQRHLDSPLQLAETFRHTRWLGLTILGKEKGEATDTTGYVSFAARYQDTQGENTLHERSLFRKEGDQWFYVEGDVEGDVKADFKIGRNDPCWCGSGKKFKKCHG